MIISLIAAMAENGVIGRGNAMPWNIASDRALFRRRTMGHPVIFGRKTFESIGFALEGRRNIVLSRQPEFRSPGVVVVPSLEAAFAACGNAAEAFICGGEQVFRQTISFADRIYLTLIHRNFEGDAFFPAIPGSFIEKHRLPVRDEIPYTLLFYEREGGAATSD